MCLFKRVSVDFKRIPCRSRSGVDQYKEGNSTPSPQKLLENSKPSGVKRLATC
jgi:hypothetical protein